MKTSTATKTRTATRSPTRNPSVGTGFSAAGDLMSVNVQDLLAYAEQQLGKPYVYGAAGPNTFDCSGLVTYIFHKFGVNLPHHAADQAREGTSVPTNQIRPGDLVFSNWGDGPNSHVGIAVGANRIIDAPHKGADVRYDDLTAGYLSHVTAVRRVTNFTGAASGLGVVGGSSSGGSGDSPGLLSQFDGALTRAEDLFSGPYREIAKPLQDIGHAAVESASL